MNNTLSSEDMILVRKAVSNHTETIVHAPTEGIATALFRLLYMLEVCWSGNDELNDTNWHKHREDMCYYLEKDKTVSYANKQYFQEDSLYSSMPIHKLGLIANHKTKD